MTFDLSMARSNLQPLHLHGEMWQCWKKVVWHLQICNGLGKGIVAHGSLVETLQAFSIRSENVHVLWI